MGQTFIVQGTLKCDGVTYKPGAEFQSDDAELVAHLRRVGALALPAEVQTPEETTAQAAAQQARIDELEAQLKTLQEAQAATADGDKSPEA